MRHMFLPWLVALSFFAPPAHATAREFFCRWLLLGAAPLNINGTLTERLGTDWESVIANSTNDSRQRGQRDMDLSMAALTGRDLTAIGKIIKAEVALGAERRGGPFEIYGLTLYGNLALSHGDVMRFISLLPKGSLKRLDVRSTRVRTGPLIALLREKFPRLESLAVNAVSPGQFTQLREGLKNLSKLDLSESIIRKPWELYRYGPFGSIGVGHLIEFMKMQKEKLRELRLPGGRIVSSMRRLTAVAADTNVRLVFPLSIPDWVVRAQLRGGMDALIRIVTDGDTISRLSLLGAVTPAFHSIDLRFNRIDAGEMARDGTKTDGPERVLAEAAYFEVIRRLAAADEVAILDLTLGIYNRWGAEFVIREGKSWYSLNAYLIRKHLVLPFDYEGGQKKPTKDDFIKHYRQYQDEIVSFWNDPPGTLESTVRHAP